MQKDWTWPHRPRYKAKMMAMEGSDISRAWRQCKLLPMSQHHHTGNCLESNVIYTKRPGHGVHFEAGGLLRGAQKPSQLTGDANDPGMGKGVPLPHPEWASLPTLYPALPLDFESLSTEYANFTLP